MTEREIIEHIGLYNEQLNIESEDDSDKNLVFMKSTQDLQSTFDKVNNDLSSTFPVPVPVPAPTLTNSQILSQGFAGFFVGKKTAVTLSESENIFDIRWPV